MFVLKTFRESLWDTLQLWRVRLSDQDVRMGTAMAAAFNALGIPLELTIRRGEADLPVWPHYLSIAVGAAILLFIFLPASKGRVKLVRWLFVLNAAAVSFALYMTYNHVGGIIPSTFPFQASKLGALVAGLLAPGFVVGILAITVHVGSSVIQFLNFSPEARSVIQTEEPWALLAFGMGGLFVLMHRLRIHQVQRRAHDADTEAAATRKVAQNFLKLRDLLNTPVQSIEISAALLQKKDSHKEEILQRLKESCERLRQINDLLRLYESQFDWQADRGGLGKD